MVERFSLIELEELMITEIYGKQIFSRIKTIPILKIFLPSVSKLFHVKFLLGKCI